MKHLIAITSCPTGVAHTLLAAEALKKTAASLGGSAVAGAISMVSGVQLLVPHGGIFAVLIPGAVTHLLPYLAAIVTGTVVTAAALFLTKKPITNA